MLNSCFVNHLQQPALELPESLTERHRMILNLGGPFNVEQWYQGCYQHNQMETGSFTFLPVGMSRRVIWDRPIEFLILEFDPIYVKQMLWSLNDRDELDLVPHYKCSDPLIHQLGLSLKAELKSGDSGKAFYLESILATLTVQLLRHHIKRIPIAPGSLTRFSTNQLQTIIDYIHGNLDQALSLDELAAVVQMNKYYLIRLFKQSIGTTLHQYVIACRIEKAKYLLAQRDLSIIEICHSVGFQTQSHFTHTFRRQVGVSPKAYRDRL